jgi:hypothetical protein
MKFERGETVSPLEGNRGGRKIPVLKSILSRIVRYLRNWILIMMFEKTSAGNGIFK